MVLAGSVEDFPEPGATRRAPALGPASSRRLPWIRRASSDGMICLARADPGSPAFAAASELPGPPGTPVVVGREPDVRLLTYILFVHYRTVWSGARQAGAAAQLTGRRWQGWL